MEQPKTSFKQLWPSDELSDYVELYWEHKNLLSSPKKMTIAPDSFFKIILYIKDDQIVDYFLTGLWTKEKEIVIPAKTTVYGIKFKLLSPEFILNREIASLLNESAPLETIYLNADQLDFSSLESTTLHFEKELTKRLQKNQSVASKKLQLSQLLDKVGGDITVENVGNQINWSSRQINRYLNKYLGISLKKYLNIQKCYASYVQIINGNLFPEKGFYDQAHFIREIKKHTSETPKNLNKEMDDRFIQLKHIRRE
ncbi:MAG: hypothetical protein COA38_10330 [Fluviicola sp.]|nr:MAG: hypothetical protein COA38_10330 [Fluviicola sp.]